MTEYSLAEAYAAACKERDELRAKLHETKSGWISVKDRLPEDDLPKGSKAKSIKVLIAHGDRKNGVKTVFRRCVKLYSTGWCGEYALRWEWPEAAGWGEITHWMSLPEPPEVHDAENS